MADKIDSNVTSMAYAEEDSIGVVSGNETWYSLEPNSYSDFGAQIKTIARKPINPTRQRKKGVTVDLDAAGGFNQDLTFDNTWRLLQGFLFADVREQWTNHPISGVGSFDWVSVAGTDDAFHATDLVITPGPIANNLIWATGFSLAANNGLWVVGSTVANDSITVTGALSLETAPADAEVRVVGYQFDSATLNVVITNGLPVLTRASGTVDYTTLGLLEGQWIFIGGDSSTLRFTNNQGFARVKEVTATTITLDKTSFTPQAETGTGKTVQIFYGDVIRNEPAAADIVRRTYQLERQLGEDADGTMSEYLVGAVANQLTINVPQADKVMLDMAFVAIDNEQYTGLEGIKAGDRPTLAEGDAFNTSVDVARINLHIVDPADPNPAPLFAYAMDMSFSVKNNASVNKAIGILGGFDVSVGTFEVDGKLTLYFADVSAVAAVRNNEDATIDTVLVKDNTGFVIDIPLITLGDGRLSVVQDQPITLPLETMGAQHQTLGYTLLMERFSYLPNLAG